MKKFDKDEMTVIISFGWMMMSVVIAFIGMAIGNSVMSTIGGVSLFSSILVSLIIENILNKISKRED